MNNKLTNVAIESLFGLQKIHVVDKLTTPEDSKKSAPSTVLYFNPVQIGSLNGASCEGCQQFISDIKKCIVVKTPDSFDKDWVCGLMVPGPSVNSEDNFPLDKFSGEEVGLVQYRTSCGGIGTSKPCKHFDAANNDCEVVNKNKVPNGKIEAGGCCNAHERGGRLDRLAARTK
jgi:hypothetical protein